MTVDGSNIAAIEKRAGLPAFNNFDIGELTRMPPFWGWVKCEADVGVSFQMLLGGADDGVALRLFWNGGYERASLRLWARLARTSQCTLDVGAHTGVYSLCALTANRSSRVISFEPHFMNFARLNLNLRSNGFHTKDAFIVGVGARNEVLPFSVQTGLDYLTTGGAIGSRPSSLTSNIQVVALDTFLTEELKSQITLVKIDVEGHEAACLSGMGSLISRSSPDIIFECIEHNSGQAVQSILEKSGYRFFEIDDSSGAITQVERIEPKFDAFRKLAKNRLNRLATKKSPDMVQELMQ